MKNASKKQSFFPDLMLSFWCGAAGWFTVLALGILFLGIITAKNQTNTVIEIRRFLFLFPCGCGLSAARLIRRTELSAVLRLLLHYFITLLSLFLFLWLPTGTATLSRSLVCILLVTLLYAVIRAVIWFVMSRINKKQKG